MCCVAMTGLLWPPSMSSIREFLPSELDALEHMQFKDEKVILADSVPEELGTTTFENPVNR